MDRSGLSCAASAVFLMAGTSAASAADVAPSAEAPAAQATVEQYPYDEGTLDLESGDTFAFSSDDPGAEIDDLYLEGALGLKTGMTPIFSINADGSVTDHLVQVSTGNEFENGFDVSLGYGVVRAHGIPSSSRHGTDS